MNRRGFLGWLGKGSAAVAATAAVATVNPFIVKAETVEATPPANLADIKPGQSYFAVLMNYNGVPVRTMILDQCPTELVIDYAVRVERPNVAGFKMREGEPMLPPSGTQTIRREQCTFRLASRDRYDGRTIEGLARYIAYKGPVPPDWGTVKLGF